jgi:hypothetical protein
LAGYGAGISFHHFYGSLILFSFEIHNLIYSIALDQQHKRSEASKKGRVAARISVSLSLSLPTRSNVETCRTNGSVDDLPRRTSHCRNGDLFVVDEDKRNITGINEMEIVAIVLCVYGAGAYSGQMPMISKTLE